MNATACTCGGGPALPSCPVHRDAVGLVRLRADPAKVRVAVRRSAKGWRVAIGEVGRFPSAISTGPDPEVVVEHAFWIVSLRDLPGLDPECGRAYRHPQRAGSEKVQVPEIPGQTPSGPRGPLPR